ncbi:MAG: hypothetical protein M5U31_05675 [Acidimicrobiia bacterium]|nr:hypothetical protein [Acidimicrobiia bacterium]
MATPTPAGEDPGWPIRGLGRVFIPWQGSRARRQRGSLPQNPLVRLRQLTVGFFSAILLFGLVLPLLGPYPDTSAPLAAVAGGLAAVSLGCVVASRFVGSLDCTDHRALQTSYWIRFFVRIAICEAAALLAFAAVFVWWEPWLYLVGAVPALVGFRLAAPTAAHIEYDQEALNQSGCDLSLLAALQQHSSESPSTPE